MSSIEGVYVPLIHGTGTRIRRRIIKDLDRAPYPERPLVPYTGIIHDRITIEIARGCGRGCRFCQAGFIYRPVRERSMDTILRIARSSVLNTGYEEISFTSLSSGDYSALPELIKNFNTICSEMVVAVSLPSLRVGSLSRDILREIKAVRKTGFTIAPEAGSERLRAVINKDYSDEEYEQTLRVLFSEGWRHIKLYFMIGLPTETAEDIESMIEMVKSASEIGKKIAGKKVNINVGVSAFVPKPHTPFQWMGQMKIEELREKKDYVVRAFKKLGVNFKGQHVETSLLEAVFSRGDERVADLLETAWREGCRFDGWSELFDFERWKRASEITGIDMFEYAQRDFDPDKKSVPWEFIDTGVETSFLRTELSRALKGKRTPDCMRACPDCGLDCKKEKFSREKAPTEGPREEPIVIRGRGGPVMRLRVMYSKTGLMRYLSHHELMVCIIRTVRRANIPVAYSSGFHPHPKISFGPALSVGVEGYREFFDINLRSEMKEREFIHTMNTHLPEGLRILNAVRISKREPSLSQVITEYEYEVFIEEENLTKVKRFLDSDHSLKALIVKAELNGKALYLWLRDTDKLKVRIQEMLAEMGIPFEKAMVRRTGLYGYNKKDIMKGLLGSG
jgi:uncharacterized protein (DUF2344 family)